VGLNCVQDSTSADATVAIDSSQNRHAISPFIYGYNGGSAADSPPGATWLRLGGNRWTAYNWETNYSNAGSDWGPYSNDTYMGAPDASQHGDFLDYYLSQMGSASQSQGRRLLDVLDLHWYSEARGPASSCDVRVTDGATNRNDDCVVAARVQAQPDRNGLQTS
jgi:mannan endo-1,4-beta-mannosidase